MNTASKNIRESIKIALKYGAKGILTTDWGDFGHVNGLALSFSGFALSAALSWNVEDIRNDEEFDSAFSKNHFCNTNIISLIRKISKVVRFEWFDIVFYTYYNRGYEGVENGYGKLCEKIRATSLEDIENNIRLLTGYKEEFETLISEQFKEDECGPDINEMEIGIDGVILSARFAKALKKIDINDIDDYSIYLALDFENFYKRYRQVFLNSTKPSRIEKVKEVFNMLLLDMRKKQGLLQK